MITEDQNQNEHPLDEESNIEQEESIWTIGRKSKDHQKTGEKFKLPVLHTDFYKVLILWGLICIALCLVALLWFFSSSHWSYASILPFQFVLSYAILYGVLLIYRPIERLIWKQTHHLVLKKIDHLYNLLILISVPILILVLLTFILWGIFGVFNAEAGYYTLIEETDDDLKDFIIFIVFALIPILVTWWAQKDRWRKRIKLSKNH